MRRLTALAAVVTMSVGVLTACSGGNYCSELQNYAEAIKHLDLKDSAAVDKLQSEAKKLSKSSPNELKEDWKIVLDYADQAKDAAGDQAELEKLAKASSTKVAAASEAIAKQAKDTCKVNIEG